MVSRFSEHLAGDGKKIFEHACKLGLEGIVSKRRDAPYRSGRSKAWLKIKNHESPATQRLEDGAQSGPGEQLGDGGAGDKHTWDVSHRSGAATHPWQGTGRHGGSPW